MDMAIAAASVYMNEAKTAQEFSTGVLKMAMDTEMAAMNEMIEGLADPNLGQNIDIMA
ncbi:MAG: YjfB family protein [Selenomonadaceae bacterium]|nr:YjfB family protein [Selenomonadaceae bacterium]MBP3723853.1 YjfB family protein [Selenomonadaceae bacterium]MBP3836768.1 YjfB family protein [Pyramidobacter sp.]